MKTKLEVLIQGLQEQLDLLSEEEFQQLLPKLIEITEKYAKTSTN